MTTPTMIDTLTRVLTLLMSHLTHAVTKVTLLRAQAAGSDSVVDDIIPDEPSSAPLGEKVSSALNWTWRDVIGTLDTIMNQMTLFKVGETKVTLSNLFVALFIVVVSVMVSRWLRWLLHRRVIERFRIDQGLEYVLMRVVHYVVLLIGIYASLTSLNIHLDGLVGLVAILGVGIGFGLQTLANNFISGIILLFERPIKVGDRITVEEIWGDVVQINLRTTVVNSTDNISIIIPNSKLLENNLINWSYGDKRIRIHVPVGVAYGSDIQIVMDSMLEVAKMEENVLEDPEPQVWFRRFGDSSLDFELVCWLPDAITRDSTISRLNRAIDQAFRDRDVEIPFPQRDLHLRSADDGARIRMAMERGSFPRPGSDDAPAKPTEKPAADPVAKPTEKPAAKPEPAAEPTPTPAPEDPKTDGGSAAPPSGVADA